MFVINKIKLINFRCFNKVEFQFNKYINILVGNNAVGKTSVIEAIYVLGCCKSHRTSEEDDLVKTGSSFYSILTEVEKDFEIEEISLASTQKGKKISRNSKFYKNLSDYIGYFKVVMFCPEDLRIIKGEPSIRRRFLDLFIGQLDKQYLFSLIRYKKILKERNEYLKKESDKLDEILLKTITTALINEAKVIIQKRKEYIDKLNKFFNDKISVISNSSECGKLIYKPNINVENICDNLGEKIKNDIFAKTTLFGPHKDDLEVLINEKKASSFASQGQQRTLALSIKLAQAQVMKEESDNVIIILDDVFGELDINRQNNLVGLLNFDSQIFITTTSLDNLSSEVLKNSKIIDINKDGDINE